MWTIWRCICGNDILLNINLWHSDRLFFKASIDRVSALLSGLACFFSSLLTGVSNPDPLLTDGVVWRRKHKPACDLSLSPHYRKYNGRAASICGYPSGYTPYVATTIWKSAADHRLISNNCTVCPTLSLKRALGFITEDDLLDQRILKATIKASVSGELDPVAFYSRDICVLFTCCHNL